MNRRVVLEWTDHAFTWGPVTNLPKERTPKEKTKQGSGRNHKILPGKLCHSIHIKNTCYQKCPVRIWLVVMNSACWRTKCLWNFCYSQTTKAQKTSSAAILTGKCPKRRWIIHLHSWHPYTNQMHLLGIMCYNCLKSDLYAHIFFLIAAVQIDTINRT